jgi:hypothetical protein
MTEVVIAFRLLLISKTNKTFFGHATLVYIGNSISQALIDDYFLLKDQLAKEKLFFSVIGTDKFGPNKDISVLLLKLNKEFIHELCLEFQQKWQEIGPGFMEKFPDLRFHLSLKPKMMHFLQVPPKEIKVTSIAMKIIGGEYFMEYNL